MVNNKKSNFNNLSDEALDNIRADRALATTLLSQVMRHLGKDEANHQYAGAVAAKYLETLQRSNEQLVKIATLKKKKSDDTSLSDSDKKEIFDMIKKEEE